MQKFATNIVLCNTKNKIGYGVTHTSEYWGNRTRKPRSYIGAL